MQRFYAFCLALLIFANGFTDVLNYKNIPLLIYGAYALASFCVLLMVCDRSRLVVRDRTYYLLLLLLIGTIFLSYYYSAQSPKGFTYFVWFNWIMIVYGIIGKYFIDNAGPLRDCIRYIRVTLVFHAILALIDWAASNGYLSFSPLAMLYRGQEEFKSSLFGIIRLRGGVEEAAHYGLYLNIFFPLSLLTPWSSRLRFIMYIGVVGMSYIATLSLAAAGSFVLALGIGSIVLLQTKNKGVLNSATLLVVAAIACAYLYPHLDNELISRINNPDDVSRIQRQAIYTVAIDEIYHASVGESLVGYGPAAFIEKTDTNPISWYLLFAHDLGVPAMILACMTGLFTWFKVWRSALKNMYKLWAQVALLAPFIHYMVTANFWHPWIWTTMAVLLAAAREGRALNEPEVRFNQPSTL